MTKVLLLHGGADEPIEVRLERADAAQEDRYEAVIGDRHLAVVLEGGAARGRLRIDGAVRPYRVARSGDMVHVWIDGTVHVLQIVNRTARRASDDQAVGAARDLTAPMPGTILKINTEAGASFEAHEPLVVMESMKMEMTLSAPSAGAVDEVLCGEGDLVEMGALLVRFAPRDGDDDGSDTTG